MTAPAQVDLQRWLEEIARIAAAVNKPVSLPALLDLVSETAARLLGYDFCAVLLPDAAERALIIEGSYGLSPSYVQQVNADHPVALVPNNEPQAPSSRAYLTQMSVRIADTAADETFLPWGGVAREQGYRSMISVPLLVSGEALGTLNCYLRRAHEFGQEETELLGMLANQAGAAIATARLRSREVATIDDLRALNASLEEQYALLQRGDAVHGQLTAVALRGGGVQGVAQALGELLELPVTVTEEPVREVLVSVPWDERVIDVPDLDGLVVTNGLVPGAVAQVVPGRPGEDPLVVTSVLLGSEEVARIWLPGPLEGLTSLDIRAVEHAATVCALELLRSRTALEVEWRVSGELVTDLLTGNPATVGTVTQRAQRLGHDLTRPHAVLVAGGPEADTATVLSVARALAGRSSPRALVTSIGNDVVVVWPADDPAEPRARADEMHRLLRRSQPHRTLTVAVLPPCHALADYPSAFRKGRGAVALAGLRGTGDGVATLDGLGLHGLLLQVEDVGELLRFADSVLRPLRDHDAARGTSLEETLVAYLRHDLNTAATAATLFVHPNTVGLRVRRAEQLLGMSTTSVLALAELRVALGAEEVARSSPRVD